MPLGLRPLGFEHTYQSNPSCSCYNYYINHEDLTKLCVQTRTSIVLIIYSTTRAWRVENLVTHDITDKALYLSEGLKVVAGTDSTSTASSNLVPDQSSNRKNDKKVYLSGKTLVEESVSDDDTYPGQFHSNHTLWITFDRHILQMTVKAVLEQEKLSDRHIQIAQSIIKKQFPLLGGLCNTLLQGQIVFGCTANTIQIVHCNKRHHWITVTTKWCQRNKVNVYDKFFDKLDFEAKGIVKKMFGLKRAADINMIPFQKQQGPQYCGVLAIATMISLAFDENPSCVKYRQSHLRSHLVDCFNSTRFTPFPTDQNEHQ